MGAHKGSCLLRAKELSQSHMCLTASRQVAEMAKRCTPSQTDVIFVVMDAVVRIYEYNLIAKRCATAMPWPDELGHVFRLSSILARQKIRTK